MLVSRDDGTWKYTTVPPEGEAWRQADFDDSRWQTLVRMPIVEPAKSEYSQKHRYERLLKLGAGPLGSPMRASAIYIRKKFTLTLEGIH